MSIYILRSDGKWVSTGWNSFDHIRSGHSTKFWAMSQIQRDEAFKYLVLISKGNTCMYREPLPIIPTMTRKEAEEELGVKIEG